MEKFARIASTIALLCLGASVGVGAIPLMADPSGRRLNLPANLLAHAHLPSFLLAGVVLLLANGLFAALVLALLLRRKPLWGTWIIAQGGLLAAWILTEILLIRAVVWAQIVYLLLALVLMACGWIIHRAQPGVNTPA